MKNTLLPFCFLLMQLPLAAQYIYYQNAMQAQLCDNPANAGADGRSQIRLSYNNTAASQIGAYAYSQGHLYFDKGVTMKNKDVVAYGLGLGRDQAGEANAGVTSINFLGAYHRSIGSNINLRQYLTVGAGATMHRRSIGNNLRWPSQIDPSKGFDPSLPGEDLDPIYYFGLDLGLTYSFYWSKSQFAKVGLSLQDVNEPNVSFYEFNDVPMSKTVVASGIARLHVFENIFVEPNIRFVSRRGESLLNIGNNFGYQISEQFSVIMGLASHDYGRYSLNIGAQIQNISTMLNFGWGGHNQLTTQVFELSFGYTFSKQTDS